MLAALSVFCGRVGAQDRALPDRAIDAGRMFNAAGQLYDLDPALLAAIAKVESDGNPSAVSPKGAQGLMQLMPATAQQFGVTDPFDPIENTLGAARFLSYLKQLRSRRSDLSLNLPELLAAYNAGAGAVARYGGIPPYAETQQYVRKVLLTYLMVTPSRHLALPGPIVHAKANAVQPVMLEQFDALDELSEIRRLRTLALSRSRQNSSALAAEPAGVAR